MRCIAAALALLTANVVVAGPPIKDVFEKRTASLEVRALRVERDAGDLEVFVYSVKNLTSKPIKVLLSADGIALGLCAEFSRSTLTIIPTNETLKLAGRGLSLAPGQEAVQSLVAANTCLREKGLMHFLAYFLVREPDGLVRAESVELGNFKLKGRGTWP
ncbi:hypothetical protein [Usitatibacter rugosus]|uniref:hypothetical protein n=1 Tax=Usitatibacter rugosus TaxID=2732067 RepID=UPI0014896C03|nr:hypothetical protein [Usitatibacter rugosus]